MFGFDGAVIEFVSGKGISSDIIPPSQKRGGVFALGGDHEGIVLSGNLVVTAP